jgi:putative ABC transport system permease protein
MKVPPKYLLRFLRWFCREDYLDEIEGDLVEVFSKQSEKSPRKAKWNFGWNVLSSFRPQNIKKINPILNLIMFQHHLKIGGRHLLKSKTHSAINIFGLSIGITCCLIIFVFIRYESSFDNFHPRAKETYRVVQHTAFPDQTLYWNTTAYPLAEALRNDFTEFEVVTQTAGPVNRFFSLENTDNKFESNYVLFVDPYYPKVFNLQWIAGDHNTALQHTNSIIITEQIARKCFGDLATYDSILGKTIMLNGKDPVHITGVVKDAPGNSNLRYEILIPYEFFRQNNPYPSSNWSGNYQGTAFVVLPNNIAKQDVESRISNWKKKYLNPEDDKRISYFLQPLESIHNETLYGSSPGGYTMSKRILQALAFVGGFILLIAIANFINLVTAKSLARAKEVGVRKIIGSTWLNLVRQFVLENTLLVVITMLISVAVTFLLLGQLNTILHTLHLQLILQWSDVGLVLILGALTILLGTLYPALVLASFKPLQIINPNLSIGGAGGVTLRKSLTVFQFAIMQLFIISAVVVGLQMQYFKNEDTGFLTDAVVSVRVPDFRKLNEFKNTLLQNKDVNNVSFGSGPPMAVNGFSLGTLFRLPSQADKEGMETEMKIGDVNYLDFYGLKLISGKNFTENKFEFDEFIVNERLLKSLGWTPEEAIGKRLVINEGEATIVGVVRDFHNTSLQNEITPCVLLNWNHYQNHAFVHLSKVKPEVLQAIEKAWKQTFTTSIFQYEFVDDAIAKEYFVETLSFKGFTIFSFIVALIGCLGLFGLMTFITSRKTKEVGIRKILGASASQIVFFFSKEFVLLILMAFLIAAPAGFILMRLWLEGFTYKIELAAWMFLSGGVITLLVALITSGFQTIKAAVANPVESIRRE